jgi:pimeloyl-ACP methyl ester carboxylesterase
MRTGIAGAKLLVNGVRLVIRDCVDRLFNCPLRHTALLAALATLSLGWILAPDAGATFKGAPGQLVYWNYDPDAAYAQQNRVFVDDPTDDHPARSLGLGFHPTWSPDGTQIAYELNDKEYLDERFTEGIGIMNADGTGKRQIVKTPPYIPEPYTPIWDSYPAWSADGKAVYYLRERNPNAERNVFELRRAGLAGGDSLVHTYSYPDRSTSFQGLVASPDGDKLLTTRYVEGGSTTMTDAVILDTGTGAMRTVPGTHGVFASGSLLTRATDWAPDGKHIVVAFSPYGVGQGIAKVMTLGGEVVQSVPVQYGSDPRFSPDNSRLMTQQACTGNTRDSGSCSLVSRLLDDPDYDPDADIPPQEEREKDIGTVTWSSFDVQPQRQPIIFVHGFAGAKLACGGNEVWLPTPLAASDDLMDMRLADDGVSPHPSGCAAQPTGILEKAYGLKDVYGPTVKFLKDIAPDDNHIFVWDWRKDPRSQVLALNTMINDALDRPLQKKQGVKKVVLMGHSMGGLVIRAYLDDASRAKKVSRAVTVGTPYWGAPKAIFPLAAGIEVPSAHFWDNIWPRRALHELFRNLTGAYFLYPSEHYGPWLSVAGLTPNPFDRAALGKYVASLGGNPGLLAQALNAHRDDLDGFKENKVDYRVYVGTGLNTIGKVRFIPGTSVDADSAVVQFTNGDGTVPARSGTQGPIGTADPLGDNVPISYVCNVDHVPLPGSPKVTTPIRDFLLYGTEPRKTEPRGTHGVCLSSGQEVVFDNIELAGSDGGSSAPRGASDSAQGATDIQDAAEQGLLQLLELPGEPIAVTDDDTPVQVSVPADGARMKVTPIEGDRRIEGGTVYYGPVTGTLTLKTARTGAVSVLDDGHAVPPRTTPAPGDPGTHARTLSIAYSKRLHAFSGTLKSDAPECVRNQRVTVLKQRPGKDPIVGAKATDTRGKYRVPASKPSGRYYASTPARVSCLRGQSPAITL